MDNREEILDDLEAMAVFLEEVRQALTWIDGSELDDASCLDTAEISIV